MVSAAVSRRLTEREQELADQHAEELHDALLEPEPEGDWRDAPWMSRPIEGDNDRDC